MSSSIGASAVDAPAAQALLPVQPNCADGRVHSRYPGGDQTSACSGHDSDGMDLSTVEGSEATRAGVLDAFDSDSSDSSEEGGLPLKRPDRFSLHKLLESGMLSAVIFLGGMLCYNVAVPVSQVGYDVWCSWLYFWGAVMFIVESIVESVYCMKFPAERLTQKRDVIGLGDRFRAVNWELWSAIFFLIPSILYLAEELVNPNIVGAHPAALLRKVGIDDSAFIDVCDLCAEWLFVVDALLRYCARWCIDSESDASDRLIRFRVWSASGFHAIDWMFWGDIMFVVGAVFGVFIKYYSTLALDAISSGLWTLDAVLYLIAAVLDWGSCKDADAIEKVIV